VTAWAWRLLRSRSFRRFVIANLVARGLATLLLFLFVDVLPVHYLIASLLVAALMYGFAYMISRYWIFK
jgi:putative flippase GtrA